MYYLLLSVFIYLGHIIRRNAKKSLFLFIVFSTAIPTSFSLSSSISFAGFYFYEVYFLFVLLIFLLLLADKTLSNRYLPVIPAVLLLLVYFFYAFLSWEGEYKYLLRDLRLLVFFMCLFIFGSLFDSVEIRFKDTDITLIALISAVATLITYILIFSGFFVFENQFYESENRYRYFDAGTYFAIAYIIFSFSNSLLSGKRHNLALLLSFLVLLVSGYRVYILATFVSIIVVNSFSVKKFILGAGSSLLVVGAGLWLAVQNDIERITSIFDLSLIQNQLVVRFGPAIDQLASFEWYHYVTGLGMGVTFYIPWFEYQGLDVFHNMVDSNYLTLFVKFGFLILPMYIALWYFMRISAGANKFALASFVFILLISFAFPIFYHPTFIIYMVGFYAMANAAKN